MNPDAPTALTADVFSGHRPTAAGDLSVETHGIAPIAEDQRYGRPGRMFTVWFAPQVTMTGVFTGTLAVALGLGFWLGMLAMAIGTVLGSLVVGYLSTWGPRTGTAQLPNSRMAFGGAVVLPAALQWLSSIAWDGLVGLFGGEALSVLLGIPFWVAVLIVLVLQGAVGFFGYELIHRVQAVLTVVLFVTFVVFAVKLVVGHEVITPATVRGPGPGGRVRPGGHHRVQPGDLVGQLRRRLQPIPARGLVDRQGVRVQLRRNRDGVPVRPGHRYRRRRRALRADRGRRAPVMGGGVLGAIALLAIALASIGSSAMNDYSGSLALQTIGVRVRRPVSAVVVTVLAFTLIMWLHSGDTASRFEDVLLLVGYWIPAFVAIVVIDWVLRINGRRSINPAVEHTERADAVAAVIVFVLAYAAAIPFMNTSLIQGPVARAWHGADTAYFVNLLVAAVLYGGWRFARSRRVRSS